MTVLQVMERTGLRSANRALEYIKDALWEINERMPEQVARYIYDVESDTRFYSLPSNFVRLLSVLRAYDSDGKYIPIPRVQNVLIEQDSSASSASSDDDLIVI